MLSSVHAAELPYTRGKGSPHPTHIKLSNLTHFLWKSIFKNIVNIELYLRYWLKIDQSSLASKIEYCSWVVLSMRPCTPMLDPGKGSPRPDKWCLTGSPLGLRRGHAAENDVSLSLNHQLLVSIHSWNCEDTLEIMSRSDLPSSASGPDHHKKSLSHFLLQRQSVMNLFKWESH